MAEDLAGVVTFGTWESQGCSSLCDSRISHDTAGVLPATEGHHLSCLRILVARIFRHAGIGVLSSGARNDAVEEGGDVISLDPDTP